MRQAVLTLTLMIQCLVVQADADFFYISVDELPLNEQFRQLSLMLMVSDGADEALINELNRILGDKGDVGQGGIGFSFDAYTTPLIRIVDQESMLAGATQMFQFTRKHAGGIADHLRALLEQEKGSLSGMPIGSISEDAIIIRNAIADSIDYAVLQQADKTEGPRLSEDYRARTTFMRNNLEYELFAADLERITREAVAAVGGRTEAYERMFDDEVDADAIDKKIRAAEYAYGWEPDFDERAAEMAQEILDNIEEMEGAPKSPAN